MTHGASQFIGQPSNGAVDQMLTIALVSGNGGILSTHSTLILANRPS